MSVSQTTLDGVVLYRLIRQLNTDEIDSKDIIAEIDEIIEDFPHGEYSALIAMANVIHALAAAVYKFKTGNAAEDEQQVSNVVTALVQALIKAASDGVPDE